jgi:hypothetical protein
MRANTAVWNALLAKKSLRKIFEDGVINAYSGTMPLNPDMAVPGTSALLLQISKDALAFTAGAASTCQIDYVAITTAGTSVGNGTGQITITYADATSTAYIVIIGTDTVAAPTVAQVAAALAAKVDLDPIVSATAIVGVSGEAGVVIKARWAGVGFTTSKSNSGNTVLNSVLNQVANARTNGLQWGDVSKTAVNLTDSTSGNILQAKLSKETGHLFSGVGLVAGTMTWLRLCANAVDPGVADTTYLYPRLDCTIGTSGTDIITPNITIQVGAITNFTSFDILGLSGSS